MMMTTRTREQDESAANRDRFAQQISNEVDDVGGDDDEPDSLSDVGDIRTVDSPLPPNVVLILLLLLDDDDKSISFLVLLFR